jgi:hypothetical protein
MDAPGARLAVVPTLNRRQFFFGVPLSSVTVMPVIVFDPVLVTLRVPA